jgi:hypothetical protein
MNTNAYCYVGMVQTAGKSWTDLFTESVWGVAAKRLKEQTEANTGCRYKLVHCRHSLIAPPCIQPGLGSVKEPQIAAKTPIKKKARSNNAKKGVK